MSSISSSDYSYFQKQLNDQADENAAERKKLKEREDERVDAVERRAKKELANAEKSHARSLERAKASLNESLQEANETSRKDYDRMKRDTYDRFGKVTREQNADHREQLEQLQKNMETQAAQHEHQTKRAEERFDREIAQRDHQAQTETERAVQATRDELNETHGQSADVAAQRAREAQEKAQRRYDDLDRDRLEAAADERGRYNSALDQAGKDYNRRLEMNRNAYDKATARQEQALKERQMGDADKLRQSHTNETRALREQISTMVAAERDNARMGAGAKTDAVKDFADDWRVKMETQQQTHQREMNNLREQNEKTEYYLGQKNNENMRNRDVAFAKTVEQMTDEHHREKTDQFNAFMLDHQQAEANAKKDHEMQQKVLEERLGEASERTNQALQNQAKVMTDTFSEQSQNKEAQIQKLQASLREHETSADTSLISPAGEAALRKQIAGQYQKISDADQDRRLRENEQIRADYKERLTSEREEFTTDKTKTSRKIASEQNQMRNDFNNHVSDLEYTKEATLRQKDEQNERSKETMTRNFARSLERQNRQSDDSMNASKIDAGNRIAALREEYEFKNRMAIRDHNVKMNETIREYDKKLQSQKTEYEGHIDDLKAQNVSQARDADRKLKTMLEEQQRNYEQKLAQQEAQHQERERYLQHGFEDEIDKLKHANAMLQNRGRTLG